MLHKTSSNVLKSFSKTRNEINIAEMGKTASKSNENENESDRITHTLIILLELYLRT